MRAALVLKPTSPFLSRVGSHIVRAVEDYLREVQMQRSIRHMRELPDYLLHDIGIDHSEITSVVRYGGCDPSRRRRG